MVMNEFEKELYAKKLHNIVGVDEFGRVPLFGPVVAACVVLLFELTMFLLIL